MKLMELVSRDKNLRDRDGACEAIIKDVFFKGTTAASAPAMLLRCASQQLTLLERGGSASAMSVLML